MSAAVSISPSGAQGQRARPGLVAIPDKPQLGTLGERINTNTISIVSGNINAAWLTIAYDLSAVLDNGDDVRVLPVIGRGGEQNVRDVTVMPVLETFRRSGEPEWLANNRPQQQSAGSQQDFDRFLAAKPAAAGVAPADRERLFQEFVRWSQANRR